MSKTQSYESYSFLEFIPTPENPYLIRFTSEDRYLLSVTLYNSVSLRGKNNRV